MRIIVCLLICASFVFAQQPNTLTPKEAAEGWLLLFDGQSTFGWTAEGGSKWSVADGAVAPDPAHTGWLRSHAAFGDFILKVEFRGPAATNSGLFIRSAKEGAPHETGYEVQIWDGSPKFKTGSLLNHAVAKKAKLKDRTWQTMEVQAIGDRYVVKLDGKTLLNARDSKSRYGHIGLQVNENNPIEFRSVKVLPVGSRPIFNGKDLTGWRRVDRENVKARPEWTVEKGMLTVVKGPGQLETEETFQDFILQLDIRTNPSGETKHPNSGVFFRGTPNGWWTGYEAQIRNEYKDGDRNQPVDFGTGGIYHKQPARKVVSNDSEFFTMTVLADGRQICTWVNGYPVADWEDPGPEGTNVRNKEAVLGSGTFSLQAHDPTTNLNFRNIRVVTLKKQ